MIYGGEGDDIFWGYYGDDMLIDLVGDNMLQGGDGNDILIVLGVSQLDGGDGDDIFILFDGVMVIGGVGEDVFLIDVISNVVLVYISDFNFVEDYLVINVFENVIGWFVIDLDGDNWMISFDDIVIVVVISIEVFVIEYLMIVMLID